MKKMLFNVLFVCCTGAMLFVLSGCGCGCGCQCCSHSKDAVSVGKKVCDTSCACSCCQHSCCKEHKAVKEQKMSKGERQKSNTGLEWEVIQEGIGETPKAGQTVVVHYTGWLKEKGKQEGTFDSSVDRGQPFRFTIGVGQVIKGWDEGVMGMKKGEKRILYIPANLAYGARGAGGVIPPNADLIFEVELLDMS